MFDPSSAAAMFPMGMFGQTIPIQLPGGQVVQAAPMPFGMMPALQQQMQQQQQRGGKPQQQQQQQQRQQASTQDEPRRFQPYNRSDPPQRRQRSEPPQRRRREREEAADSGPPLITAGRQAGGSTKPKKPVQQTAKPKSHFAGDSVDDLTSIVKDRVRMVLDTSALGKPELGFAEGGPPVHDLLSKLFAVMLVDNADPMRVEEELGNYIRENFFREFYTLVKGEVDAARAELKGLDPTKAAPKSGLLPRARWRMGAAAGWARPGEDDWGGKGWGGKGFGKGGMGASRPWNPLEEYRLSPLNGKAYPKGMFLQHFGGTKEWDTAPPAPPGFGHSDGPRPGYGMKGKGGGMKGVGAADLFPAAAPSAPSAASTRPVKDDEWDAD